MRKLIAGIVASAALFGSAPANAQYHYHYRPVFKYVWVWGGCEVDFIHGLTDPPGKVEIAVIKCWQGYWHWVWNGGV